MNTSLHAVLSCVLLAVAGAAWAASPVANGDTYQTMQDNEFSIAAPGVLANDTDADGDTLTATLTADAANGAVDLQPSGAFTYTPQASFYGSDSFSYEASDGTTSSAAVVAITVVQYAGVDDPSYSGGGYGALSPGLLLLLALAALYPRGLKASKRRCISP
jgi:hypothetical protein